MEVDKPAAKISIGISGDGYFTRRERQRETHIGRQRQGDRDRVHVSRIRLLENITVVVCLGACCLVIVTF